MTKFRYVLLRSKKCFTQKFVHIFVLDIFVLFK